LAARERAQAVHTLLHNYRSTPGVIAAVNQVFSQAVQPFGVLDFLPALPPEFEAASGAQTADLIQVTAMTVWHLDTVTPLSAAHYLQRMSEICASQMVTLLQSGAAQPAQLAVLVRDGREARAIRQALQMRGVRSVYLSDRDSVFATREALDLWHILQAIAQPQSVQRLRSALSCRTLGLAAGEIEHLLQDEAAWDAQVDRFCNALQLFKLGFSWAGPISLVVPYDLSKMRQHAPTELTQGGFVRLSIGLESSEDLIADLAQALAAIG
jgi:exodeoxyribonuclease V beta subunit